MRPTRIERIGTSAFLFESAIKDEAHSIINEIDRISLISPFRNMRTQKGIISVEMTNCGEAGWVSDTRGYRYTRKDPLTGMSWPAMENWVHSTARDAARLGGFPQFSPNACLINRYFPGKRLGMHVDKDEADTEHPIVSFSLGASAIFRWGGLSRHEKSVDILLKHGDVLVWGGKDRLRYHGISKVFDGDIESGILPRYAMTFRYTKSICTNF